MRALVYAGPVDYGDTERWNSPSALWVHDDDVLNGVVRMPCPDCGGTGRFPMPEPGMANDCVMCKETGLVLVSV